TSRSRTCSLDGACVRLAALDGHGARPFQPSGTKSDVIELGRALALRSRSVVAAADDRPESVPFRPDRPAAPPRKRTRRPRPPIALDVVEVEEGNARALTVSPWQDSP